MNYYNELDPNAVQWLRNLIAVGDLPDGVVDTRSIEDVDADDLVGYRQCHFFAGIGGWSLALQLAGWPADRPVWTGSCPCQPFSAAGKRKGVEDERHLWPTFARLIAKRKPPIVFGEQVASPGGREWFSGVRADLEAMAYAVGAADLCAAGVKAPHIRQRIFWVADANRERWYARDHGPAPMGQGNPAVATGHRGFWDDFEAHKGDDGKIWRTGPGAFPVAHGIPGRVGQLRGYGNAIVPQVGALFIRAVGVDL